MQLVFSDFKKMDMGLRSFRQRNLYKQRISLKKKDQFSLSCFPKDVDALCILHYSSAIYF